MVMYNWDRHRLVGGLHLCIKRPSGDRSKMVKVDGENAARQFYCAVRRRVGGAPLSDSQQIRQGTLQGAA